MPRAITPTLFRPARWSVIAALLLICLGYFWAFNFSLLPFSVQALRDAGCGQGLLDARPYYDATAVSQAFACYGEAGRAVYHVFLLLDTSFALCYGLGFSFLLSRLQAALNATSSRWRVARLLPLGVALSDVLENISLLYLLASYPVALPALASLAGMFTLSKWVLSILSLAALAACYALLLWRRTR